MLPSNDELPSGNAPFTTDDLWKMKQKAVKPHDITVILFSHTIPFHERNQNQTKRP